MDFNAKKPLCIEQLPTEVCIEFNDPVDDVKMDIHKLGGDWKAAKPSDAVVCDIPPCRVEGCRYYFLLEESLAACVTTGRYMLVLKDGCDYCACLEVQFRNKCFIVNATTSSDKKLNKGCC